MRDRVRIGVDTGGTFTDVVVAGPGGVTAFKVPSTPHDPSLAILAGLDAALDAAGPRAGGVEVVHGTTVGTNALLERTGAKTAFVATAGFEDLLRIGRQARPELYNLSVTRPPPLVPPERCFGLEERVDSNGLVVRAADEEALDLLAGRVRASGAESVAVCLLFAFANPAHERLIEKRLTDLGLAVSASHRILPEYREYERAATTAVNAYLEPRMRGYIGRLSAAAVGRGVSVLRVMQSSGGSISALTAAREPVRTILSGPAGGVVAAAHLSGLASLGDLITFDMGGTSTDVALVAGGRARVTSEASVAGLPVAVPVIDIHTVGAGGGSVARVDEGGALRVGPESAGADPGPACYGRGTLPTVTDANVVLGRLGAGLLGGRMKLDADRARRAVEDLAAAVGRAAGSPVSVEQAALGVVRVAAAGMERALRVVSIERGYDPRGAALLSFGGAGGLHACDLAESLGVGRVIVPPFPGAFSALGLLLGDIVRDVSRTVIGRATGADEAEAVFAELERAGRETLAEEGVAPERMRLVRTAALRYRGQSFEIDLPWDVDVIGAFHAAHQSRYGHADVRREVELVHLRVRAVGELERPALPVAGDATPRPAGATSLAPVCFEDGWEEVPVFDRAGLGAGAHSPGPALVTEYGSTTLVPRGWRFEVDAWGCLLLSGGGRP